MEALNRRAACVRRNSPILVLLSIALASSGCAGMKVGMTPIQLSLVQNAQVFSSDTPVRGLDFNLLAGQQDDVIGLDFGLLNGVGKEFTGISVGLVNDGNGNVRGLQAGLGNAADVRMTGLQTSIVNQADGEMFGAQVGVGNFAGKCTGMQLGVVNKVDSKGCLQLGLFNLNPSGFLPFFPIFLIGW